MDKDTFINEMLNEIKDLKDLAKDELPLLVKEYINYNVLVYGIGFSICTLGVLISLGLFIYGIYFTPVDKIHDMNGYEFSGMLLFLLSIIPMFINGACLLSFLYQPRRMAIQAITSLKG